MSQKTAIYHGGFTPTPRRPSLVIMAALVHSTQHIFVQHKGEAVKLKCMPAGTRHVSNVRDWKVDNEFDFTSCPTPSECCDKLWLITQLYSVLLPPHCVDQPLLTSMHCSCTSLHPLLIAATLVKACGPDQICSRRDNWRLKTFETSTDMCQYVQAERTSGARATCSAY